MTAHYVTIIVPIYNAEQTLQHCLTSIVEQTYENLDIILINDGSTDDSLSICVDFAQKDKRIKVINQKNSGPSHARNRGIEMATGAYIQFVDADDMLKKTMTESLVNIANKNNDLVLCGYEVKTSHHCETIIPKTTGQFMLKQMTSHIGKLYEHHLLQSPCNKLYKTTLIKNNDISFPVNINLGEDLLFNLDYLKVCEYIEITEQPLYIYYNHEQSLSKQVHENYLSHQFMLINKVKEVACHQNKSSSENEKSFDAVISQVIINTFSQLFDQHDGEKKRVTNEINNLFKNNIIQAHYDKLNNHLQAKLLKFFIQFHLKRATYLLLKAKDLLRKQASYFYRFFRAINNFSKK